MTLEVGRTLDKMVLISLVRIRRPAANWVLSCTESGVAATASLPIANMHSFLNLEMALASNKSHHIIGVAAGVAAAAIIIETGVLGHHYLNAILALVGGYIGGILPDKKRPWAQIVAFWVPAMIASYYYLHEADWVPLLFGLACGGVFNVLAGLFDPPGVPLFWSKKYSINLWKGSSPYWLAIALAWGISGWLSDEALTDGKFSQWAWREAKIIGKEWGGEAYQRSGELLSYLASRI